LAAFAAPFLNTPLRISDLHKITATLNAEYAKRSYPVHIANIPPQKIKDGVVNITLIEARLGEVRVEGNSQLSAEYVTSHLRLKPSAPIHVGTLEDRFVYFNRTNRAAVVAELKPGWTLGTTDIVARVQEPPAIEYLQFVDNAGRSTTGLYRGTAMVRGYSWLLPGDSASVAGIYSRGTRTVFGSYEVPFDSRGDAIGGSYAYGETQVISGPFKPLNVTGISHSGDVYLSAPLYASAAFSLKAVLHATYYNSTTDFVDVLSDREETYGGTLGIEGDWNDAAGRWAFAGEVRNGRAIIGDDSAVPDPRDGRFWKFSGHLSRTQRFNDTFTAYAVAGGQYAASKRLASSEQLQIGGVGTVRGYPEGSLLADHGYFARLELWMKPTWIPKDAGTVASFIGKTCSLFIFADHAGTFPFKGHGATVAKEDFLTSVGGGLSFNYNDVFTAQITGVEPLDGIPSGKKAQYVLFRLGCHFSW
jgi:hemolysin activation/secretion protein